MMLEALIKEVAAARDAGDGPPADVLRASWSRLREEAVAAQVGRLLQR
jgi:hypothetical protein